MLERTWRRSGRGTLAALACVTAVSLAACGGGAGGGLSLARQACAHVERSITDYEAASRTGVPTATATSLLNQADRELRDALPLAAAATSDDGSWNSLMTTISEGAVVDEGHLVPALRATCASADANVNVNPSTPTTPPNVNPQPAAPAG
jgi:hypothetical protein